MVEERLKLEALKREFMKEKQEAAYEEEKSKSKRHHKHKHHSSEKQPKSKFESDFENMWKQKFGESYRKQ